MAAGFELRVVELDGSVTIGLLGELDMSGARRLEAAVQRACAGGCEDLVIDLGELALIDSCGVRVLLAAVGTCAEHYCRLEFVRSRHSAPRWALRVLGIDRLLAWRE